MPASAPDGFVLHAERVLRPDGTLEPGWLTVAGGRVVAVDGTAPQGPVGRSLSDGVLAPGFVDLQFNGACGVDLGAAPAQDWPAALAGVLHSGVTSVVATFVSAPTDRLLVALEQADAVAGAAADRAARIAGVHLEGPFLAPARRGAHEAGYLQAPDPGLVEQLIERATGRLAVMTLAPELPGADGCIARLVAAGVVVALGHTEADADTTARAADLGARLVTHLYNAQPALHHRNPGVVGQTLADARLTASVIADLQHVAPAALRTAFAAKAGGVALITDSVAAAGLPAGRHRMPDGEVIVTPGAPPRRPDGTLAGSALRLDEAVRNVVGIGVPVADALQAATLVPADLIGRHDLGRIEPGAQADLVWLDDELRPRTVWLAGQPLDVRAAAAA